MVNRTESTCSQWAALMARLAGLGGWCAGTEGESVLAAEHACETGRPPRCSAFDARMNFASPEKLGIKFLENHPKISEATAKTAPADSGD